MDGRADLYSLGILAYELITYKPPFEDADLQALWQLHLKAEMPDPRWLVSECPNDLAEFVLRCTQKLRADRFVNAQAAHDFLLTAGESKLVDRFDLASVAISYHPSRRVAVETALRRFELRLRKLGGVSVHSSLSTGEESGAEEH